MDLYFQRVEARRLRRFRTIGSFCDGSPREAVADQLHALANGLNLRIILAVMFEQRLFLDDQRKELLLQRCGYLACEGRGLGRAHLLYGHGGAFFQRLFERRQPSLDLGSADQQRRPFRLDIA